MSINDSIGNGTIGSTAPAEGTAEPGVSPGVGIDQEQSAKGLSAFATRTSKSSSEGLSKGKLLSLGGGLAVAVLFFIITAIAGHAPKKQIAAKPQAQQQKQAETKPAKGSVTPVMDTVRTAAPDNSGGQLGPGDIRRTRALTGPKAPQPNTAAEPESTDLKDTVHALARMANARNEDASGSSSDVPGTSLADPSLAGNSTMTVQQQVQLLKNSLEATRNSERNLRERLNQTNTQLDEERRRNRTLKGANG